MAASENRRIVDSSVLIGAPIGGEHEYARYYAGKQLLYCSLSEIELQNHFVKEAYKHGRNPQRAYATAEELLSRRRSLFLPMKK